MRNPLARYYDFATQPRHGNFIRAWLLLPVLACLLLIFAVAAAQRHGIIIDSALLRALVYGSLAAVAVWLVYVAYRLVLETYAGLRWLGRKVGPSWTSGWRAASRTLFGRSGKTD